MISLFIAQVHSAFWLSVSRGNGPSQTVVEVQILLFASLALSLFAAFLAALGNQWLNRYASVDVRGSVIDRSQNRQRKLDGVADWHFDYMMGFPTSILPIALLLLSRALSNYLSEVDMVAAQLGFRATLFGVLFYLIIVVAGAVSTSCPYQTPSAHILRHIFHIPGMLHSVLSTCAKRSACRHLLSMTWDASKENYPRNDIPPALSCAFFLPVYFLVDACRLFQATVWPFTTSAQRVYRGLWQGLEQGKALLDLRCISWTLQTSLEEPVRLSALSYLAGTTSVHFDPTIFVNCLDILTGCINVANGQVTVTRGLEQLATLSALCCLHTLSPLTTIDPRVEDLRQRYTGIFPPEINIYDLPFSHILGAIHNVFYQTRKLHAVFPIHVDQISLITWRSQGFQRIKWKGYKPPVDEQIVVARALSKLALFEYRRTGNKKMPRWLLRFAFRSLSQDPLPPTSVVVDCLSIIAVGLGYRIKITTTSNERYVCK